MSRMKPLCVSCGDTFSAARRGAGYQLCLPCGEQSARRRKHTIVPLPKSNYIVVTDPALLIGLNSSHKGNR
jgi:tRNA(Ile2) C34 agmatinyltransferase TiaS